MTKVLVTGSNGFLGRRTVRRLLSSGADEVRCLVRAGSARHALDEVVRRHGRGRAEIVAGSLATASDAEQVVRGCDVVYHLAASLRGAPSDIFLSTVVATRNLLEAMRTQASPPKLVHVSSFSVYGVARVPRGARIDERTPLEAAPARRDPYAFAKLRQEQLVWEYGERHRLPVVVMRPGVVFGPGGGAFSSRVGVELFGVFLHLGGDNHLPLTFVDNCADALVVAGAAPEAVGHAFNVVDDDAVTASEWLRRYKARVRPVPSVRVPYPVLAAVSKAVLRYHVVSRGQLPAVFTPYKTASTWRPHRFDNGKLVALGWKPRISTEEALDVTFEDLRTRLTR